MSEESIGVHRVEGACCGDVGLEVVVVGTYIGSAHQVGGVGIGFFHSGMEVVGCWHLWCPKWLAGGISEVCFPQLGHSLYFPACC